MPCLGRYILRTRQRPVNECRLFTVAFNPEYLCSIKERAAEGAAPGIAIRCSAIRKLTPLPVTRSRVSNKAAQVTRSGYFGSDNARVLKTWQSPEIFSSLKEPTSYSEASIA